MEVYHVSQSSERVAYADRLRFFALFAVIVLHISASNWTALDIYSIEWQALNFYDSISRWCVPVFVMLSGMFMLDPEKNITIKMLFTKYLFRISTAFLFWSLLYTVNEIIVSKKTVTAAYFFGRLIEGRYHLWFLYMIAGLYLLIPILRLFTANAEKELLEYFLVLSLIFTFANNIMPNITWLSSWSGFGLRFQMNTVTGYVGYFMAGYYFKTYRLRSTTREVLYFLGILGALVTFFGTYILSFSKGEADALLYSYFSPNVVMMSIAVFLLFQTQSESRKCLAAKFSMLPFGMYLVHDFWNIFLIRNGITSMSFNPWFSIPILSVSVFAGSFVIAYLLSKIPICSKYFM